MNERKYQACQFYIQHQHEELMLMFEQIILKIEYLNVSIHKIKFLRMINQWSIKQ